MTLLTVWPDTDPDTVVLRTTDGAEIALELKRLGVRFERWRLAGDLPAEPSTEEVVAAYRKQVDRVVETEGYVLVDAMHMTPADTPEWRDKAASARRKFLSEHGGVFYLHVGDRVYAVLCEAGDLLSVPANTTHWFDMGTRPDYVSIRFFHTDDGWVGNFTGSQISQSFPDFDSLHAGR